MLSVLRGLLSREAHCPGARGLELCGPSRASPRPAAPRPLWPCQPCSRRGRRLLHQAPGTGVRGGGRGGGRAGGRAGCSTGSGRFWRIRKFAVSNPASRCLSDLLFSLHGVITTRLFKDPVILPGSRVGGHTTVSTASEPGGAGTPRGPRTPRGPGCRRPASRLCDKRCSGGCVCARVCMCLRVCVHAHVCSFVCACVCMCLCVCARLRAMHVLHT